MDRIPGETVPGGRADGQKVDILLDQYDAA